MLYFVTRTPPARKAIVSNIKLRADQIKLDPDAFKDVLKGIREHAKKDPELHKTYVKARTKVSSEIKMERLLQENPEISLEVQRKKELREAKRKNREAQEKKEAARKEEIRAARKARIAAETSAKEKKAEEKKSLFDDASLSEEVRTRIVRLGMYDRRDNGNKLTAIKCCVTYKTIDNKYSNKAEVVEFSISEENTLSVARDVLVAFLVEIENE